MIRTRSLCAASLALLGTALFAQPAAASLGVAALPMAVAASAFANQAACPAGIAPAAGTAEVQALAAPSKSAAILGGAVSQLDLIRQQQSASLATQAATLALAAAMKPAAGPSFNPLARPAPCPAQGLVAAVRAPVVATVTTLGSPIVQPVVPVSPDNFLASKRVAIRHTVFDRDWARVSGRGFSAGAASRLVALDRGNPGLAELNAVNSWANARIRYVEDRDLYGKADYWATAGETLRRRAGDCEDIAIAKMQLLAALGVPRGAMYLTIARDTVRTNDHAVLVVRMGDKAWLLDNATDRVLDASQSYDYRPIVSFSENQRWIHGY